MTKKTRNGFLKKEQLERTIIGIIDKKKVDKKKDVLFGKPKVRRKKKKKRRKEMKKLVIIIVLVVMIVMSFNKQTLAGNFIGYFGVSVFPVNDEHNTPATLEGYAQYNINKKFFITTEGELCITNNIPGKTRTDHSYITGWDIARQIYPSDVQFGIGYNLNKSFDARLIYRCQRWYTGYEGDSTGVQLRWNFGKK